jgi:hypothetical protein
MRTLLSLLALALIVSPAAHAQQISTRLVQVPSAASNATDYSRGYEVDADTGWTPTDTGGLISRYSTTQAHSGTHSMEVAGGGVTTQAYQTYDSGATRTATSICLWFYTPTVSGDDVVYLLNWGGATTGSPSIRVSYSRFSGAYYFRIRGTTFPAGVTSVSTGAWYRLELDYVGGGTCSLTIYDASGSLVETITATAASANARYLHIGRGAATALTTWSALYIDDLGIDWTDATHPLWPYTVNN